jgi:hypothetical protein
MALPRNLATDDVIDEVWTDAVVDTLTAREPTPWTALPLNASWANSAGLQPLQYRKEGDRVWMRGDIQFTAGGANPPWAALPAGYRPPVSINFALLNRSAAVAGLYITIQSDGVALVAGLSGSTAFSLGALSFSTVA